MKYRVTSLLISDMVRFTVETKDHWWWNKWNFIFDGKYPRLFNSEELKKIIKNVKNKEVVYKKI